MLLDEAPERSTFSAGRPAPAGRTATRPGNTASPPGRVDQKPGPRVGNVADDLISEPAQPGGSMSGFKKFLLRGNLVDLAVAVVIGVAFNAVIQALIADLITPIISAIFGKPSFSNLTFTVNHSTFKYGSFINALLSFLIIAAVVYFLVVVPAGKVLEIAARKK